MSGQLIKRGQAVTITPEDIKSTDMVLSEADPEILEKFRKTAAELKSIAPKAEDFLYFTAVMMHAAEASLLDDVGNVKAASDGSPLVSEWIKDQKSGSWKWSCSDPSVMPYKNSNADIFPEEELILAYKNWIGKPLCLDHKSSSVDAIRGVVVDTYYDKKLKRVIALCALDKKNYPDLARKVSTGYATSVSMGTAVGRAICTDCGRVAQVESDFCDHMRNKSCYGEINVGLNPIELSIVVNGADPKAKIRHIVASADSIANYIEMKEKDLAQKKAFSKDDIRSLKAEIERIQEDLVKLETAVKDADSNEDEDAAYGQPGAGSPSMESPEGPYPDSKKDLSTPPARYATKEDAQGKVADLHEKLDGFINKLAYKLTDEESQMTEKKAYFQGAGGVNEPAPKQVKYPKEDYESLREGVDKQMVGQMETGPVDGMHPGYDSFGESEEARKKRLQRLAAEQERRQLRRQAALEKAKEALSKRKEAYYQGGGDVNEPTPGKPKYPKEDYEKTRDKEDKQMLGQPPFPGVGSVDGLHPSPASADEKDELKRKQMLSRASLSARFIKAANPDGSQNKAESYWQVFADKKEILRATVNELTGGRTEAFYDDVATKAFAKKIISTIKTEGFEKAAEMFKGLAKAAQAMPAEAGPAAMPAAPPDASGAPGEVPAAPEPSAPEAGEDVGAEGDPLDQVGEKIREMDNLVQELSEAFEALKGQEVPEMATPEMGATAPEMGAAASVSLPQMCKTLNGALRKGIKQAVAELKDHREELKLVSYVYNTEGAITKNNSPIVNNVTKEALADADKTIANTYKLMSAFVKFARGSEAMVKRAGKKIAQDMGGDDDLDLDAMLAEDSNDDQVNYGILPQSARTKALQFGKPDASKHDPTRLFPESKDVKPLDPNAPGAAMTGKPVSPTLTGKPVPPPKDYTAYGDWLAEYRKDHPEAFGDADDNSVDAVYNKDKGEWVIKDVQMADDSLSVDDSELGAEASVDLTTKEGRAQMRTKVAQKGLQFSDMLQKAHPSGGTTTSLDVKPSLKDGAHVEDLKETHDAFMDVASAPPKVRKSAEEIQRLVVAGAIDPKNDFPALIAEGLDPEAVKYWKQMWGEAKDPASTQFASELVKEHVKKKAEEEMSKYRVKVARAYELAHQMASVNLCGSSRESISEQVNSMMKWDDEAFESMQRMADRHVTMKKTASLPHVGMPEDAMVGTPDVIITPPAAAPSDLKSQLEAAFATTKKHM
jgi:hypothetical protein